MKKNQKKMNKILLCILAVIIFVLIILNAILASLKQNAVEENIDYENISSVKDVLNYYGCKYISEDLSTLDGFSKDIRLVFACQLYDGEKSNEEFFNNVTEDVARILNYSNCRLIDQTNHIEIKIMCDNGKVTDLVINDQYDYFIYTDSKNNLSKYEPIKTTSLEANSQVLQNLISNNWSSKENFGTRESIFEGYNEYFDEGIEARLINGKVYNIIFTKKYNGDVVNGLFPGIEQKDVKSKLGNPTFEDESLGLIGYKGENYYAFFTEDEISIYRIDKSDTNDFFKLVDKLIDDELDLLDFMNELTYLWPDYSEYKYDSNYAFISYPLKGIDIKIGYEDTNGIVLYNNVNASISKLEEYINHTEFVANMSVDNVFEAEKRRSENKQNLLNKCKEYIEEMSEDEQKRIGESLKFGLYAEKVKNSNEIIKLCFVSKDGNNPNRELSDTVNSYLWLNSDILIFSQKRVGIFYYNVLTGEKQSLITGEEEFKLKEFKNGILSYDDSELRIQY